MGYILLYTASLLLSEQGHLKSKCLFNKRCQEIINGALRRDGYMCKYVGHGGKDKEEKPQRMPEKT